MLEKGSSQEAQRLDERPVLRRFVGCGCGQVFTKFSCWKRAGSQAV